MSSNRETIIQHYVPKTLLQGFSSDSNTLYEFYICNNKPIEVPVSIEDVCRERLLYEFKDENGEPLVLNDIENALCNIEGEFATYRRQLLQKARNIENCASLSFLSKDEKDFWRVFTSLQVVRNPVIIQGMTEILSLRPQLNSNESTSSIYNQVLGYTIPFFRNLKDERSSALTRLISIIEKKDIFVGYAESDNLYTSDHAVFGYQIPGRETADEWDFHRLYFPVSSNCCVIFSDSSLPDSKKNGLVFLSENDVYEINKGTSFHANRVILSKYSFSEKEVNNIRETRKERL